MKMERVFLLSVVFILLLGWAWMGGVAQRASVDASTVAPSKHSSSAIAITSDGNILLAVNPDSNSLTFVDTASQAVIMEMPVGVYPRSVAISPDDQTGIIANQGSDSLSIVDIPMRVVTATLEVGDRPMGVAVSPDGRFIAVAELGDDQVRLLNAANFETITLIPVADRPQGVVFTPDNRRLLISHLLSGKVTLILVQPFQFFLPLVSHHASAFNLQSSIFPPPSRVTHPRTPLTIITTWPNIAPAPSVIINATGTRAYLPQTMANGLGYNTGFDTTVFPKVSVLNLETNTHQTTEHISLPETDRPVGLPWDAALAKNDTELWVVNSASNDVSVIDISNPTHPTRVANIPVGDNPRGIVIAPDGRRSYVNNTLAGTVSVIDANAYTVTEVITVTTIPLPPALLNGKQLYFSSARPDLSQARWISCNTCHIEGEGDGRTWLLQYFGDVPPGEEPIIRRNTTSLLGMIETYPLRWSAEWDESADSEFSVRFEQFGSGLIVGDMHPTLGAPNQGRSYDLDCLALYIDSLSVPSRIHKLTEAEQRGKVVFESPQTQCADCHPAPIYTDLQVHDVGTADGAGEWFGAFIDTPSLRFLYDSAPYLHDGSAQTLWNVLTINNVDDQHGMTSHLTDQQLADLESFLLALPYQENP
jgi:YVTN family beta-propeller protein